jgi:hypothetical protein
MRDTITMAWIMKHLYEYEQTVIGMFRQGLGQRAFEPSKLSLEIRTIDGVGTEFLEPSMQRRP